MIKVPCDFFWDDYNYVEKSGKKSRFGFFLLFRVFCLISFKSFSGKKIIFILVVVCVLGLNKSQVLYDVDGLNDS